MIKKIISILLVTFMVISFTACATSEERKLMKYHKTIASEFDRKIETLSNDVTYENLCLLISLRKEYNELDDTIKMYTKNAKLLNEKAIKYSEYEFEITKDNINQFLNIEILNTGYTATNPGAKITSIRSYYQGKIEPKDYFSCKEYECEIKIQENHNYNMIKNEKRNPAYLQNDGHTFGKLVSASSNKIKVINDYEIINAKGTAKFLIK